MKYPRRTTKWCPKHPPPPASFRDRVRKWLGRSYHYKQGVWCDCPSAVVIVPTDTYLAVKHWLNGRMS
jgi:hypothetical protein